MSEYTTKGIGNAGLATGIIGTALGVLNGGAGLLNLTGAGTNNAPEYVTKDTLDMAMTIARKDSEIALLKSEQNTEVKIADVYERIMTRVNADQRAQADVNAAQAVYNATNGSAVAVINSQVAQLMGLTQLKVKADNVCPRPMDQYNSWTAPT